MHKLLYIILVILALIVGGIILLVNNLDSVVRRAIEVAGTNALGTEVRVGSVDLDLARGSATLSNFSIANPPGFSTDDMVRFDELFVALDLASLSSDVIRINSVRTVNPSVMYEMQGTRSNLDVVRERFPAQAPPAEPAADANMPEIAINELNISGIQATLMSDLLPAPVNVSIGDVVIPPVQGTPAQLARQIAGPLVTQLGSRAASALAAALSRLSVEDLRNGAQERLNQAEDAVRSAADQFRNFLVPQSNLPASTPD